MPAARTGHRPPSIAASILAAAAVLVLVWASMPASALDFPALNGRVNDTAGILTSESEQSIEALIIAHEQKSSDQIVVATIPSLEGAALEDYANRLFRFWELGQEELDNGVLLLVAVADRKVRIEVGYGLEGTLTDALSRLVIENAIVPRFREGDYAAGIIAGTQDIIAVLAGDAAGVEDRARQALQSANDLETADYFAITFFILIFGFVIGMIVFSILATRFGKKIGKNTYRWLGVTVSTGGGSGSGTRSGSSGWSSGSSGSSGFSGGGGSSGGGGASGSW